MAVSSACRRQLAREKSARRFVRRALNACEHSYARGRKGALRARTYATAHHGLHRVLDEPERKILMAHAGSVQHFCGRHRSVGHGVNLELRALSEMLKDLVQRIWYGYAKIHAVNYTI